MPTGIPKLAEFYLEPSDAVNAPGGAELKEVEKAFLRIGFDLMLMSAKCGLFDKPKLKIGTYSISSLECSSWPDCDSFMFETCDGDVRIDMWRSMAGWLWSMGKTSWCMRVKGSQKAMAGLLVAWKSVMDKLENVYKAKNHQLGELVKAATEFNQLCKEQDENT